jgi:signal transduction histidine kinase
MYCEDFAEKSGLKVDFQTIGFRNKKLNFDTEMNLYRLIQEGLNNVRKHAAARKVTVRLVGAYPQIILNIRDDGKGFDVEERERKTDKEKRMGLQYGRKGRPYQWQNENSIPTHEGHLYLN